MPAIEYAPTAAVDAYEDVAREFMVRVLGMAPGDYAISDESRLSDFASCGLPAELGDGAHDLQALYRVWDCWVVETIAQAYGLQGVSPSILLVELFQQLATATGRSGGTAPH